MKLVQGEGLGVRLEQVDDELARARFPHLLQVTCNKVRGAASCPGRQRTDVALTLGFAALIATLLGGSFALKYQDKLHLILGFSAGAVLGVALFDLLPEALDLTRKHHAAPTVTLFVAIGFFAFMFLN